MPTYEEWELLNASYLLKTVLPNKFPGKNIKIAESYLEDVHKALPKIVVEVTAAYISSDIASLSFKINGQPCKMAVSKIGWHRYRFTVEGYDNIELLINAANQRACVILNDELACTRDGMERWIVYPQDKSKECSTIPHLRSYSLCENSAIAKACIYEVMEKMTGKIFTEEKLPKEGKIHTVRELSGNLAYLQDQVKRYYLCYEKYSLEKLLAKPFILYLFTSMEELIGHDASFAIKPKVL
jgi:hypothetical protein